MRRCKSVHHVRQKFARNATGRGNGDQATAFGCTLLHLCQHTFLLQIGAPGIDRQDFTGRAEDHACRAPFEQLRIDLVFQIGNLPADGRSCYVQAFRRLIEGPRADHFEEITQRCAMHDKSFTIYFLEWGDGNIEIFKNAREYYTALHQQKLWSYRETERVGLKRRPTAFFQWQAGLGHRPPSGLSYREPRSAASAGVAELSINRTGTGVARPGVLLSDFPQSYSWCRAYFVCATPGRSGLSHLVDIWTW